MLWISFATQKVADVGRKDSSPRCLSQCFLSTLLWVIHLWWISLLFQMTNQRSNYTGVSLKWLRHTAVMIAHIIRLRSHGAVLQKCLLCLHSLASLHWLRLQPWRMCTGEWSDVRKPCWNQPTISESDWYFTHNVLAFILTSRAPLFMWIVAKYICELIVW